MTVDPILPLSISIAEGERTYALFLGSGISRKAGIPTGREIFNNTIKLLYEMENSENNTDKVEEDEIEEWFKESKYKNWGYSEILEALRETPENRRKFLEEFFLGKKPTEAHNIIAEMVGKNLIKCIVTTNFDRLMEQALDVKGISYDVVTSDADLKDLKPREHCNCRIYKLHGDYHKSNIKNTKKELENLDNELKNEFRDVLNNYGIVIMGYSGSDDGVMKCFEDRENPRYTLYWLTRERVKNGVKELIRQQNGKEIIRDSADDFLKELSRKIEIFQTHKTGETPEFLIQEVIDYLRSDDYISFNEALKKQKNKIEEKYYEISQKTNEIFKSHEDFEPHTPRVISVSRLGEEPKINESLEIPIKGFAEFEKYINVLTAIGLITIEYGTQKYFKDVIKALTGVYELLSPQNVDIRVSNISKAAVHNVYYQWGAYALKKENFDSLKELMGYKIIINNLSHSEIESKEIWLLLGGENILTFDRNSVKIFKFLLHSYEYKEFLKEFFRSHDVFLKYLYQFNLVLCLYSIKVCDATIYAHSARLDRHKVRLFIEPFLFKIKMDHMFNYSISEVFNDMEGIVDGEIPIFIENYPERCQKLNESSGEGFNSSNLPCDFFIGEK